MGNTGSNENVISEEILDDYVELTYLSKREILQSIPCSCSDAIYRVFSSRQDGYLSFENTLDLYSAFSANCPRGVQAAWAFEIFDFDGDNQVFLDDLQTMWRVRRLVGTDERGLQARIDQQRAEDVARIWSVCIPAVRPRRIYKGRNREAINPFAESREAAFYCNKFPDGRYWFRGRKYCKKWTSLWHRQHCAASIYTRALQNARFCTHVPI